MVKDKDKERPRRKRKKNPCEHYNRRGVYGRDGTILWRECKDCRFDFPLIEDG